MVIELLTFRKRIKKLTKVLSSMDAQPMLIEQFVNALKTSSSNGPLDGQDGMTDTVGLLAGMTKSKLSPRKATSKRTKVLLVVS